MCIKRGAHVCAGAHQPQGGAAPLGLLCQAGDHMGARCIKIWHCAEIDHQRAVGVVDIFQHAANGGAGDDILDGGRGSNFLTGGSGTDTFFLDGRGSSSVIWSTITDWDNTEELSVWGWGSSSTISWEENQGTSGYEGATFSIELNGNGVVDMKCTFTGFAVADIKSPTEFEDSSLLWFV